MKREIHETDMIHQEGGYVIRHSILVMMQHWLVAISGLVLLFSGFGGSAISILSTLMQRSSPSQAFSTLCTTTSKGDAPSCP